MSVVEVIKIFYDITAHIASGPLHYLGFTITCRSPAMPRICLSDCDLSRPWQGRGKVTAWKEHGNGMVCMN
jgi:hypothetical protein